MLHWDSAIVKLGYKQGLRIVMLLVCFFLHLIPLKFECKLSELMADLLKRQEACLIILVLWSQKRELMCIMWREATEPARCWDVKLWWTERLSEGTQLMIFIVTLKQDCENSSINLTVHFVSLFSNLLSLNYFRGQLT